MGHLLCQQRSHLLPHDNVANLQKRHHQIYSSLHHVPAASALLKPCWSYIGEVQPETFCARYALRSLLIGLSRERGSGCKHTLLRLLRHIVSVVDLTLVMYSRTAAAVLLQPRQAQIFTLPCRKLIPIGYVMKMCGPRPFAHSMLCTDTLLIFETHTMDRRY